MRVSIPWYGRIIAKLIVARLPVPYSFWKRIGIYSHGEMQNSDYALKVFNNHLVSSGLSGRTSLTGLEMGPGDSVGSAVAAKAAGFSAFYLVDAGNYANRNVETYKEMSRICSKEGSEPPDIEHASSFDDVLAASDAIYLTNGLQSYREVPTASIDLVFSQAVLEHVRRNEFAQIATEMRRILKPNGVDSHQVDLRDHLGGALDNMRIGSALWETEWMARSGFYTNRIRFSEMCQMFEYAGFDVKVASVVRWNEVPISVKNLAPEFQHLDQDDLLVSSFHVLLRPKA
jgi:SAM-dependent methyltransferase